MRFGLPTQEETLVTEICEALESAGYKFSSHLVGIEGLIRIHSAVIDIVRRVKGLDLAKAVDEDDAN